MPPLGLLIPPANSTTPPSHLFIFRCANRLPRLGRRYCRAQGYHPRTVTAEQLFTRSFKGHARPRLVDRSCGASRLLGLVGLSTQARGGRAAEVPAKCGSQEGAEDDLGTPIALLDEISWGVARD